MEKHIHEKEIKAWADGEKIEALVFSKWIIVKKPLWYVDEKYRIYDEHREVKEAFERGEEIECYNEFEETWLRINSPNWQKEYKYRVKPQPVYVPYSWEDGDELIGKRYVCEEGDLTLVLTVGENHVNGYGFTEALEKLTHTDGTPFGKLKSK